MSMNTTLHAAARDGNMELVRDIVDGINGQAKVSINTQNSTGQTAMHLAAKWGRLEVVKYLIEAGADLEIRDRRGRTPIHDADDAIVQTHLQRGSVRLRMQMDVGKSKSANDEYELKQLRQRGELTEEEFIDAMQRLEAAGVWVLHKFEQDIETSKEVEELHNTALNQLADYMRRRPEEMKAEQFKERHKQMVKHEKEEERKRLEAKKLKEIEQHEARREADKAREEKRELKELLRERKCGKCGQAYKNETNRGGQCVHKGEWTNWGTNTKGEKVEWLFYWTCCKSHTYEGPAAGHSCCSRSGQTDTRGTDSHEEGTADIMRREVKERNKRAAREKKR